MKAMGALICELSGNPAWTKKLYAARDRYHSLAEKENSDKFKLMGDRANALATKNKMSQIGDQKMKQFADNHYKMLTHKQYPNRGN
jgi:hypothetical protein